MSDIPEKRFRLKCPNCSGTILCDESIVDLPKPECADCGHPVQINRYPCLRQIIEEREAAKQAEKERKQAERGEQRRERELAKAKRREIAKEEKERLREARAVSKTRRNWNAYVARQKAQKLRQAMAALPVAQNPIVIGFVGSAILAIGVFMPIMKAPLIGDINYFMNGQGDGAIILVLAGVSVLVIMVRVYAGLWITGLISLVMIVRALILTLDRLAHLRESRDLSDGAFSGLADAVQLQWGWPVLIIGALLLCISASVARAQLKRLRTSAEENAEEQLSTFADKDKSGGTR